MSVKPTIVEPRPGLVISYSYLWRDEARRGREEGVKDRPCVVVLLVRRDADELRVYVAPVTHTPPSNPDQTLEIPAATKARLGLDAARSWIVTSELNVFSWPGYDIRRVGAKGYAYGVLPRAMTVDLVENIRRKQREGALGAVNRDN